jgi:hypothetical protein
LVSTSASEYFNYKLQNLSVVKSVGTNTPVEKSVLDKFYENCELVESREYFEAVTQPDMVFTLEQWEKELEEHLSGEKGYGYWAKDLLISKDDVFNKRPFDSNQIFWYFYQC